MHADGEHRRRDLVPAGAPEAGMGRGGATAAYRSTKQPNERTGKRPPVRKTRVPVPRFEDGIPAAVRRIPRPGMMRR